MRRLDSHFPGSIFQLSAERKKESELKRWQRRDPLLISLGQNPFDIFLFIFPDQEKISNGISLEIQGLPTPEISVDIPSFRHIQMPPNLPVFSSIEWWRKRKPTTSCPFSFSLGVRGLVLPLNANISHGVFRFVGNWFSSFHHFLIWVDERALNWLVNLWRFL